MEERGAEYKMFCFRKL